MDVQLKHKIISGMSLIDAHRARIDSMTPEERGDEFKQILGFLKFYGFNSVDDFFQAVKENEFELMSVADGGMKGEPFRLVRFDDHRMTPFISLRSMGLIPDTLYIGTPTIPTILTTPAEYAKFDLDYCTQSHIQIAPCLQRITQYNGKGIVILAFILKGRPLFNPLYLRHLVYIALSRLGKHVTEQNNDIRFRGEKVFGCYKSPLHKDEYPDITMVRSFLDLNMTDAQRNLFLRAYKKREDATPLAQVGSLEMPDIDSFVLSLRLSIEMLLGNNLVIEPLSSVEVEALDKAGVCL